MSFVRKPLSITSKNGDKSGVINDGKQLKRSQSSSLHPLQPSKPGSATTKPSAPTSSNPKPSLPKINPENEILLCKIKLLQIAYLKEKKMNPSFTMKMEHLKRDLDGKMHQFSQIMNKLEEYKKIQERENELNRIIQISSRFYNHPTTPSLESLEKFKQEYKTFLTILSNRHNMMKVTGNIFVHPGQVQSAMIRLLPSLEKETENILALTPQASSLSEKIELLSNERTELEKKLEILEEEESRKDREWELKKQKIKDSVKALSIEYMKLENEMISMIQELSPLCE